MIHINNTNLQHKFVLKKQILQKLKDTTLLTFISVDTGIKFTTLKRQVKENHEYLTLYAVLYSISQRLNKPINSLICSQKDY